MCMELLHKQIEPNYNDLEEYDKQGKKLDSIVSCSIKKKIIHSSIKDILYVTKTY